MNEASRDNAEDRVKMPKKFGLQDRITAKNEFAEPLERMRQHGMLEERPVRSHSSISYNYPVAWSRPTLASRLRRFWRRFFRLD